MPTNLTPTSRYLKPWSIVDDEELRLLRELRTLCAVLRHKMQGDEVLFMQGVSGGPFEMGRAAQIIRELERMGK